MIHGPRWPALCAGLLLPALALAVMSGWPLHLEGLLRIIPGAPSMRFDTAGLWLLTGAALLALSQSRLWLARVCSAAVVVVAFATLSQTWLLTDLGFDNLWLGDWARPDSNPPGRMAAVASFCFLLLGCCLTSLALPDRSRRRSLAVCLCGSAVAALGTVVVFGYIAGRDASYGWFASGGMAIHTAVAFALCGSTIISIALPRDRPWSAGGPAWLPLPVFVGLCTTALVTWQALRLEQNQAVRRAAAEWVVGASDERVQPPVHAGRGQVQIGDVPTARSAARGSYLPEIVLALGLAFAALTGSLTYFAQQARFRQAAAEQTTVALQASERKLRAIFDETFQFIGLLSTDGAVLAGNRSALDFAGVLEADVAGKPFWETPWWTHSPEQQQRLREAIRRAAHGELVRMETTHLDRHGDLHFIDFSVKPVFDEQGQVSLLIPEGRDITDRKQAEEQLARAARLDKLTGLPNRGLLLDRLQQTIARAWRSQKQHYAVMFLDFDRFKLINDSLGHEAGDILLQQIARRLQENVRAVDSASLSIGGNTTARLGGDEFVILLDELENPCDVIIVAERLLGAFAKPYQIGTHEVLSTASIGIVTGNAQYERAEEVLRDADTAMYEAKRAGRACYCVFDASMRERAQRRLQLEIDLRKAAEAGQLSLVYQPILSISTGEINGVEALLRWLHPTEGPIEPGEFLPIAEESDLVLSLGEWVLLAACRQIQNWITRLGPAAPAFISVNLSPRQLVSPDLVARLGRSLAATGLDPRRLQLEVSESSLSTNQEAIVATLRRLREHDIRLAIDDYGTGCLSFATVNRFPIDMLKVDGRLLVGVEASKDVAALVHSLAVLVKNLGICLVAEGVETSQQAMALQELGCDYAQGYFFVSPMPADELEQFLSNPGVDRETWAAMTFASRWVGQLTLATPMPPYQGS